MSTRRSQFVTKLKGLRYKFHDETDRTYVFRRGEHRVYVPKRLDLDDEWVESTLRACGCTEEDIHAFLQAPK